MPDDRGWCVHRVTFTNTTLAGATVKLKLYLVNDAVFTDFPLGYRYGWLEVLVDQPGDYDVPVSYPSSYMDNGIEPNTKIEFAVEECTAAPGFCGGSVQIRYRPGPPPAP